MKKINYAKYLIYLFFFVTVIIPLFKLFLSIAEIDVTNIIAKPVFQESLINSLTASFLSSIIALLLALLAAFLISKSKIRYKYIFTIILTIPMLIPSISHGMGLVMLFGDNGIFSKIFNFNFNIYGLKGIVLV